MEFEGNDRRAWRRLSKEEFAADLTKSRLCRDLNEVGDMSVDDLVQLYDQQMTELLDKLCPLVRVRRKCLRSTNCHLLAVPSCAKSSFASRAFCVSSPNNWNSLPAHIRSSDSLVTFQSRLKSHLFSSAYHV